MHEWSPFQRAIFENVAHGTGHTIVDACAGSGKTSTIEEAVNYVPQGLSALFVAFNKAIADELGRRLAGRRVEVSTLHSYGLRTVTAGIGRLRIHKYRVDDFLREAHGDEKETANLRRALSKVVSLAKGALAHDAEAVDALIDSAGVELPSGIERIVDVPPTVDPRDWFVAEVLRLLDRCRVIHEKEPPLHGWTTSDGCLDFDDMVWLPIVHDLRQRQFDRVFVDERQDLNAAQVNMVLRAVRSGGSGRLCAVGDPDQEIYQFRGSDARAFDELLMLKGATRLPLSVSYRCSRAVVGEVHRALPGIPIQPAPDAPLGEVSYVPRERMEHATLGAQAGDFILSRTNAPLIGLCMRFLRAGRKANIQGRDVGDSLAAFVKKSGARTVESLRDYVEGWRKKECARLSAKRRDTQAVEDRAACLLELSDGAETIADVVARIEELFSDRAGTDCIVLSSTHKAKGLERDRVWLLVGTYMRRPEVQEMNLYYVAVTRARRTLFLVEGFEKKSRRGTDADPEANPLNGLTPVDEVLS
jgi:DNA helicase II / ATP-dependent DNA helicase PcrA